jgi:hypothetical protein
VIGRFRELSEEDFGEAAARIADDGTILADPAASPIPPPHG